MSPLLHSATATAAAVRGLEAVSLVSARGLSYAGGRVPARTQNIIGGRRVESSADTWLEVRNPATAELVTQVPQSTHAEMEEAVASAKAAFRSTGVSGSLFPVKLGQLVPRFSPPTTLNSRCAGRGARRARWRGSRSCSATSS